MFKIDTRACAMVYYDRFYQFSMYAGLEYFPELFRLAQEQILICCVCVLRM